MKHNKLITLCIAAMTASSHAAIIQMNDFEDETSAALGVTPVSVQFVGGGGDHVGTSAIGVADVNPRSGSYNYAVDGVTANNGNGWGGTWAGVSSLGNAGSNVTTQANAVANGTSSNPLSYVNITEGTTFTFSAWVATDATNPVTGSVVTNVRLEFKNAGGDELFRNDNGTPLAAGDLSTTYQQVSHSYTVTAADITAGVTSVTAVYGTDGHGFGNGSGLIYADDFLFEVDEASLVTVIPEPSSAILGLLGALGLAFRRRR